MLRDRALSDLKNDECPLFHFLIFVKVSHGGTAHESGQALLAVTSERTPAVAVDVDTRTGDIVNTIKVGKATAWRDVPTPAI
jgi:hypothetical protein